MKLRNKKTGEIVEADFNATISGRTNIIIIQKGSDQLEYSSLAELNEEWEDYEEPKEYYTIDLQGDIIRWARHSWDEETTNKIKGIGNYFETKEEAEKAVGHLRAWKRLKDKGFSIYSWDYEFDMVDKPAQTIILRASAVDSSNTDLDLLFSGGEE